MYNRVRYHEILDYVTGSTGYTVNDKTIDSGEGFCSSVHDYNYAYSSRSTYPLRYTRETISDNEYPPFRQRKRWADRMPLPFREVHHESVRLLPARGDVTITQSTSSGIFCLNTVTKMQTCNPIAWLSWYFGPNHVKQQLDMVSGTMPSLDYASEDWFSMSDEFDEKLTSIIPSNFFSGEAFAEGSIYLDAIKLVTRPGRTVTSFIKGVKKRGLHRLRLHEIDLWIKKKLSNKRFRMSEEGYRMGSDFELTRHGLREFVNGHLSYKFGVLPAIHDLKSTLSAHSKVDQQLRFLNRNRGRYVPIRVRRVHPVSFPPDTFVSSYLDFKMMMSKAESITCLSGMARVRSDIHEASSWRAYAEYFGLNKVVGTAWELIPFTFVVDWFTNAQERINKLTRIPLGQGPFMNLTSVGSSQKNVVIYDYVCNPGYDQVYGLGAMEPNSQFPMFSVEVSDYIRSPGIPDTSGFVDLSNLGLFQGITGAELLIQKLL